MFYVWIRGWEGKKPMDDTHGKSSINIDEDDHVASLKSDSDYKGIFRHFSSPIWNIVMKYMFKML